MAIINENDMEKKKKLLDLMNAAVKKKLSPPLPPPYYGDEIDKTFIEGAKPPNVLDAQKVLDEVGYWKEQLDKAKADADKFNKGITIKPPDLISSTWDGNLYPHKYEWMTSSPTTGNMIFSVEEPYNVALKAKKEDDVKIEMSGWTKAIDKDESIATISIKGPTLASATKEALATKISDVVAKGVADYVIKEHLQEIVAAMDFKAVSNLVLSKVLLSSGLADKNLIEMLLTPKVAMMEDMSIEMAAIEFLEKGPGKDILPGSHAVKAIEAFVSWVSSKQVKKSKAGK